MSGLEEEEKKKRMRRGKRQQTTVSQTATLQRKKKKKKKKKRKSAEESLVSKRVKLEESYEDYGTEEQIAAEVKSFLLRKTCVGAFVYFSSNKTFQKTSFSIHQTNQILEYPSAYGR